MNNSVKKLSVCFLTAVFAVFAMVFTTCELGLGSMVNTEKPLISTPADDPNSTPGAFLQTHNCANLGHAECADSGNNRLALEVEQPFGLREVYVTATYWVIEDGERKQKTGIFPAKQDPETGLWYADLPTGEWADGRIVATVTAVDVSGNTVTTTDMIYNIKNSPPQIELSIPKLKGIQFDSPTLNSNDLGENKIYVGTDLMGTAYDEKGIGAGFPKIMIWPAEDNIYFRDSLDNEDFKSVQIDQNTKLPVKIDEATGLPSLKDGDHHDSKWGKWHTVVDTTYRPLNMDPTVTVTAMQFRWPLVNLTADGQIPPAGSLKELPPASYNVMIVLNDTFDNPNWNYYPNRLENSKKMNPDSSFNTPADNPIKFMTMKITAATNPILRIRETPPYYNPDNQFVGVVSVEMPGEGQSPQALYARFSHIDDTDQITDMDLVQLTPDVSGKYSGGYTISMSSAEVKANLAGHNLSGEKYWLVKVKGLSEDSVAVTRQPVIFDNAKPSMNFVQPRGVGTPEGSTPVTSRVEMRGSVLDNQIVDKLYYALGHTEITKINNNPSSLLKDNNAGFWLDTKLGMHTATCTSTCDDPDHTPVHGVHPNHQGGGTIPQVNYEWDSKGILQAWMWTFTDIAQFCAAQGSTGNYFVTPFEAGPDNNLWKLPIKFKMIDKAGNVGIEDALLILDPDGDLPVVTYNAPKEGATVGGIVRVNGMAVDNEWVHSVEIRVYNESTNSWAVGDNTTWKILHEASCDCHDHVPTETGSMSTAGSAVNWFYNLNDNGSLTPPAGTLWNVRVEVRARDAFASTPTQVKAKTGNAELLRIKFDPGMPVISEPVIIHGNYGTWNAANAAGKTAMEEAYSYGMNKVAGKITLRVDVSDDGDLSSIRVDLNGTFVEYKSTVTPDDDAPFIQDITTSPSNPSKTYRLFIPIDTTAIRNGEFGYNGTPNIFTLFMDATEDTDNKLRQNATFTLQIDNFHPLGNFDGLNRAQGSYEIKGKAWDSALGKTRVGGVSRVVVYFSKPANATDNVGTFITLDGAAGTSGTNFVTNQIARKNRTGTAPNPTTGQQFDITNGDNPAALNFFPVLAANWTSNNNGIVIAPNGLGSDTNQTGFSGSSIVDWSVFFNSTRLGAGPFILNYVVFDQSENATHYSKRIFIANNRPEITSITLGTDNDNDGNIQVTRGETFTYPQVTGDVVGHSQIDPNFRVQNQRLQLVIDTKAGTGNGQKKYQVYYATRTAAQTTGTLTAGNVYTIIAHGDAEWFNYGAPEFHTNKASYNGVTFVASETFALPSGASVYGYTRVPTGTVGATATSRTGNFDTNSNNSTSEIRFGATGTGFTVTTPHTNAFASGNIADSTGISIGTTGADEGKIIWNKNDPRFIIAHVYDTVPNTTATTLADQLSHVALINIGVTNADAIDPRMEIAQMGFKHVQKESTMGSTTYNENYDHRVQVELSESEYDENVVTSLTGKRKGYVQYRSHDTSTATEADKRANVSGMVIFKGKMMDNSRINNIQVLIGGTIAGGTTTNGIRTGVTGVTGAVHTYTVATYSATAGLGNTTNTIEAMRADDATNAWGFYAAPLTAASTDQFTTTDYGHVLNWSFAWDSSTYTNQVGSNVPITFVITDGAGRIVRNTIYVNIVPYISEIETPLSKAFRSTPSAFNRSATGWYPVRENDIITIRGFNLGTSATVLGINSTTLTHNTATTPTAGNFRVVSKNEIIANVGATATSGALSVTVNSIVAINNTNNTTAHYNKEPNNVNNNMLTDDRNLYIWKVNAFFTEGVGNRINSTTGTGNDFPYLNPVMRMDPSSNWYMNFGGSSTNNGKLWARKNAETTTEVISAQNRYRHTTVAYDSFGNHYTIAANQTAGSTNWQFFHKQTAAGGTWRATTIPTNTAGGDRFQIPRIATQTTGGTAIGTTAPARVLISYFDTLTAPNNLYVHYGLVTSSAAGGATLGNPQTVASNTTNHNGSMFTAVGFLSTGRPVIAWYDRNNSNLVLSYGNVPTNATTAPTAPNWQTNARIVHSLAGSHVDMVIDPNNNIHLAYYDSLNGGLYYAMVPSTGTNTIPNVVQDTQYVKIDTYLSAGTRIMLNVRQETHTASHPAGVGTRYVPYISYFHASFDETKNSIRVAWQRTFPYAAGSDANDRLTGAWEVMTVPAENTPASGQFICNGVPTSGTPSGTATTGFHTSLAKTMIVTYTTDTNYEGAMLKHDMY